MFDFASRYRLKPGVACVNLPILFAMHIVGGALRTPCQLCHKLYEAYGADGLIRSSCSISPGRA